MSAHMASFEKTEERRRCIEDICPLCKERHGLARLANGDWVHLDVGFYIGEQGTVTAPNGPICAAAPIHERWHRESHLPTQLH
jgi:hypothetical protein